MERSERKERHVVVPFSRNNLDRSKRPAATVERKQGD
jgi:hypothetical protein